MNKPTVSERLDAATLEKLANREVTVASVAAQLGVTAFYLGRVMRNKGITRIPGPVVAERKQNSEVYQAVQAEREELAKKVKSGEITMAVACRKAGVCDRTMRRHVAKVTLKAEK